MKNIVFGGFFVNYNFSPKIKTEKFIFIPYSSLKYQEEDYTAPFSILEHPISSVVNIESIKYNIII